MSIDLSKVDVEKLKGDIASTLGGALADLVEGTAEDIQGFASDIAKDGLEAQLTGQTILLGQLADQLKVLAEINRVRVENHTFTVLASVTKAVFSAALAGILSVLL